MAERRRLYCMMLSGVQAQIDPERKWLDLQSVGRQDAMRVVVTVQGGIKKTSNMKSHVISTKTSLDWIYTG